MNNSPLVSTSSYRLFSSIENKDGGDSSSVEEKGEKDTIDVSKFTHEIHVEMPEIVEGKCKILKWYKSPGDIVHPDDTICDIQTSMFTFGMDVEDECLGIMKEILVEEDVEVEGSGVRICTILHEEQGGDKKEEKETE